MAGFRKDLTFADPAETTQFGQALAPLLSPGDAVLLAGDLGSGKTHLARAIVQRRLEDDGRAEDVPSPTFTLVQVYEGANADIWHCDLYRLGGPAEVAELGLDEAFEDAICLVEWPDRLGNMRPDGALTIRLSMTRREGERAATLESDASRWSGIVARAISAAASHG